MTYFIYFLLHNNKIVYIGQSGDIHGRVISHRRNKVFDSIRSIECHIKNLNFYEKRWIDKFKPKYNKTSNQLVKRTIYKKGEWSSPMSAMEAIWRITYDKRFTKNELRKIDVIDMAQVYDI